MRELERAPNTVYALSYSYGKDSGACIHVIRDILKWPLDVIITADVWATDTIPADLPPMVNWKAKADKIIYDRYGIPVTHVCAMAPKRERERERELSSADSEYHTKSSLTNQCSMQDGAVENSQTQSSDSLWSEHLGVKSLNTKKLTYEDIFYRPLKRERIALDLRIPDCQGELVQLSSQERPSYEDLWLGNKMEPLLHRRAQARATTKITGWANKWCLYCTGELKREPLRKVFSSSPKSQGTDKYTVVQYLGIAADEPLRIEKHKDKPNMLMPLVEAGWTEQMCRDWCEDNDLLSPIYTTSARGGCWFCHNQGVDQLRQLRHNYPEYWALMLKWDNDSPVTFHPDGHTVHDFDKRFQLEDEGFISPDDKVFRWAMLDDELNYRLF